MHIVRLHISPLCLITESDTIERYLKVIVERYKDSPNIFAWELMNEARCLSDTLKAGPDCVPGSNTLLTGINSSLTSFEACGCILR